MEMFVNDMIHVQWGAICAGMFLFIVGVGFAMTLINAGKAADKVLHKGRG